MKNKEGGGHHIATDHGPMVQGGLLTTHPGSVHVGGEAPGGQSSLRQGAGKRSSDAPDLGSAAAAEQRRSRKRVLSSGVSGREVNIGEGGQPGGPPGVQTASRRGPTLGRTPGHLGTRWGTSGPPLGLWKLPIR